jgi:hypothetical protein
VIETRHGSHDSPGCGPAGIHANQVCPDDIPVLPGTGVDVPSPNLIKYQLATSAAEAAHFYQTEMPTYQWLASQSPLIRTNLAVLSYVKDGCRATIIIHQDEAARTRVMVTIVHQAD